MTGTPSELLQQRDGALLGITLNRPAKGNALSSALVAALQGAVDAAYADGGIRLLVLDAAGRHFCTGFDLSNLDEETDDSLLARFTRVELLLQSLYAAPFDTLALAQGRVMGAGADIFGACAHRWIVGDASFAFPGPAFGLVLGTARLADAVGEVQARTWVQGGGTIDAASALSAGFAQQRLDADAAGPALASLLQHTVRLDGPTHRAIHAALGSARRPRGDAGDAADLQRLVQSAARPGLRDRIAAYRAASTAAPAPAAGAKA